MKNNNKETIREIYKAADRGDIEAVMSHFAEGYVDHEPGEVRRGEGTQWQALERAFRDFAHAFPDTRHTLHDLIAEGDRVVARVSATGTHSGDLAGFPATGRVLANDSIVIYRLEDGKIVERWSRERSSVTEQLRGPTPP